MNDTADPAVEQYRALLDVAKAIASHRHLSDLFQDLTARLHRVLDFHYLSMVLYNAAQHVMRLHNLEASGRSTLQPGAAFGVEDIPSGWVWQHQRHAARGTTSVASGAGDRSPGMPIGMPRRAQKTHDRESRVGKARG